MTDPQFERLIAILERLAVANERGAAVQEAGLQRDLDEYRMRDSSDLMKVEQMRASLAVWDAQHPAETAGEA